MKYPVTISVLPDVDLTTADAVRQRILLPWLAELPEIAPTHLQQGEPVRARLDLGDDAVLGGTWTGVRRGPGPTVEAVFGPGGDTRRGDLGVEVHGDDARALRLLSLLVRTVRPVFAMAHVLVDDERDASASPIRPDIQTINLKTREARSFWGYEVQLQHGLPTLFWRTYFGPPYVGLIGRDRLLSTPGVTTEETGNGVMITLRSEAPTDGTWLVMDAVRRVAMEYIGSEFFWPGSFGPVAQERGTLTPKLDPPRGR